MNYQLPNEWDQRSVEFPLNEKSIVFELGGYIGRWALEIAERFHPRMYVFEPQDWAFERCRVALSGHPEVRVFSFGLGKTSGKFNMGNYETDGCSFVNIPPGKPTHQAEIMNIADFLRFERIKKIDLLLMNIEGMEFEMIPYMLETGIMKKINYFMCQFHPRGSDDARKYEEIRHELGKKKHVRFDYGTTLMCWENY